MKGTSLIVNVVLFIAVIVLFILHFAGNNKGDAVAKVKNVEAKGGLKIAYVKADSVVLNYDLSQDLHNEFTKKQEAYTNEYGKKRQSFEKEVAAFQEKYQRGGFLTKERAQQEQDRLVSKENEIKKLDQELSTKLATIQQENSQKIMTNLSDFLKRYNEKAGYDYILTESSILLGPDTNNITSEVLSALNEEYNAQKDSSEEETK